jgi:hypothetical protein
MAHEYVAGKRPSKYNNTLSAHWFVFGTHSDGTVDVAEDASDVVVNVPKEIAEELIACRQVFLDKIEEILTRLPSKVR